MEQQQSFLSCNRFDISYEKEEKEFVKVFVKETKSYLQHLIYGKSCKLRKNQIMITNIVHLLANCLYLQTLSFSDRIGKVASSPADLCHLWRLEKHFCCTDGADWSISVTSSSDTPNRVANVFQPFTASGFCAIFTKARLR